MSAIPWYVWVGVYAVGWFVALPRVWRLLSTEMIDPPLDTFDTWGIAFLTTLISLAWPLLLVIAWVRHVALAAQEDRADR